jgi:DMSO/TMAO reductase YedYZ molybdopterin-dependent catalytic subunit
MSTKSILLSRRGLIGGLASGGGLLLSGCSGDPPTYGNVLRMGDNLTYNAHRLFLSHTRLAPEYDRSQISSMPATGTVDPTRTDMDFYDPAGARAYAAIKPDDFAGYRLTVEGSVERPGSFSLADLKRMPSRTQVTKHMCEEGWTAIAEWTGVPLGALLAAARIRPSARYVYFDTFDAMSDSIDMVDALHPQTILAYGMNGRPLPLAHGAPLRVRVERQIGYKSPKFVRRIVVSDRWYDPKHESPIEFGWAWYNGA